MCSSDLLVGVGVERFVDQGRLEGVEHEVCAVLQATLIDKSLDPDPDEVGGLMWVPYERLHENPRWYRQLRLCPWFEIAMRRDFE